jgi:5'(3')-deoxyribonucleotidase
MYLSGPVLNKFNQNINFFKGIGISYEIYENEKNKYLTLQKKRFESNSHINTPMSSQDLEELKQLQETYHIHNTIDQYKDIIAKYKNIEEKFPLYEKYIRKEIKEKKKKIIFNKILRAMNKLSGISNDFMSDSFIKQ